MDKKSKILHWSPRILAILFVAFLCLFSLDSFDGFDGWKTILAIGMHLVVPAVVLLAAVIAWKKDLVGVIAFFVLAVCYICLVGLGRHWSWYASISGPALLIAILFLLNWLRLKNK